MPPSRPVALVTGASAGIGREIARVLAPDHDLILTSRREAELQSLAEELRPPGATCLVVPVDLADAGGPGQLLAAVAAERWPIDVLVNNAGFGDLGPFVGADPAQLLRMLQVNIAAFTELLSLVVPGMNERGGGRILNVGSVAGFQPGPYMAVYYATKAYVNSLSQALTSELKGAGITVTCLCPGPTESEFAAAAGFEQSRALSAGQRMSARAVAEAGVRGMKRAKALVIPGWRNRLMIHLERLLPRWVVIRAVRWMLSKRL
jgi:short-subunit dehydrogenase